MSSIRPIRLGVESLEARAVPARLAVVSLVATDAAAAEAGSDPARFAVRRSGGDLSRPLTVCFKPTAGSTAGAADFAFLPTQVVIPAGQTSANIVLTPNDDAAVEGTESIELALCTLPSYRTNPAAYQASALVADNDPPPLDQKPVLMVIANRDFYYQEYGDTRAELEAAGVPVVVAAQDVVPSYPHTGSGQGSGTGEVMPDIALAAADADDYSAIVFVGGWGSSSYQYAFAGTYYNSGYNGTLGGEAAINELINDFVDQDKYVAAICHGVSALAWARVDGQSLLAGKTVSAYALGAPGFVDANGSPSTPTQQTTRWHVETNGATMVPSRSIGDPFTAADDVIVDGRIITAENFDSARQFGRTVAAAVQG